VASTAIALAAVAVNVAFATPTSTGVPRGTVVFLGDSNEVLSGTALDLDLLDRPNGYVVVNVARPGATIRFGDCARRVPCPTYNFWKARVAGTLATVRPDVWIVDLGINDTVGPGTAGSPGFANYGDKIDWLMHLLGDVPVLWTNLPCKAEPSSRSAGCNAVNAALAHAPGRHTNLDVLRWDAVANPHPEYLGAPPAGVHLTAAGAAAWSALVTHRLDAMFTGS